MTFPIQLETFQVNNEYFQIYLPDKETLKKQYETQKSRDPSTPFPYWAQVWPSSIALSQFLINNKDLYQNKKVLELAAGLGLPSIVAAKEASMVICSDYLEDAIQVVQKTVIHNRLTNVHYQVLNWNNLPEDLSTDVLLLSDINYEPEDFDILYKVIQDFIMERSTIIISTPQRLMAKPFINRLLKWCVTNEETTVLFNSQKVPISVLVLRGE